MALPLASLLVTQLDMSWQKDDRRRVTHRALIGVVTSRALALCARPSPPSCQLKKTTLLSELNQLSLALVCLSWMRKIRGWNFKAQIKNSYLPG